MLGFSLRPKLGSICNEMGVFARRGEGNAGWSLGRSYVRVPNSAVGMLESGLHDYKIANCEITGWQDYGLQN